MWKKIEKTIKVLFIVSLLPMGFLLGRLSVIATPIKFSNPIFNSNLNKFEWNMETCSLFGTFGKSCNTTVNENYSYIISEMNNYYLKQKPVVNVNYNPAPKSTFELPECTTCDYDYMGRWVCKTKRSMSCY
jgi:hypothetical protein